MILQNRSISTPSWEDHRPHIRAGLSPANTIYGGDWVRRDTGTDLLRARLPDERGDRDPGTSTDAIQLRFVAAAVTCVALSLRLSALHHLLARTLGEVVIRLSS